MTTLKTFDGAGLADGTVLAAGSAGTGDSAVAVVNGNAPVTDDADTPHSQSGERAFLIDNNAVNSYATFTFAAGLQHRARFYFKTPSAWPASAVSNIGGFRASGGRRSGLSLARASTPGCLRLLYNSTEAAITPNNTMALSTWYCVELIENITSSSTKDLDCKLYNTAGTLLWTPGIMSVSGSGADTTAFWFGIDATSPRVQMSMAHLKVTDDISTDIGMWYVPPPAGKVVRRYNGSIEGSAQVVRRYNGTSEILMTTDQV